LTDRRFGFNLALGLNILGFILFSRHRVYFVWFLTIGNTSLVLAILCPIVLRPLKKLMDRVIFCFSWIVSAVSFTIIFYFIFTPIGIIWRVFRKDLLHQRIDRKVNSYWLKRKEGIFSKKDFYERMG